LQFIQEELTPELCTILVREADPHFLHTVNNDFEALVGNLFKIIDGEFHQLNLNQNLNREYLKLLQKITTEKKIGRYLHKQTLFENYLLARLRENTNPQDALHLLSNTAHPQIALALFKEWDHSDLCQGLAHLGEIWLEEGDINHAYDYYQNAYNMAYRLRSDSYQEFEKILPAKEKNLTGVLLFKTGTYAILRSLHPKDKTYAQYFSNACAQLAQSDAKRGAIEAIILLRQAIFEQNKSHRCVFPSMTTVAQHILGGGGIHQNFVALTCGASELTFDFIYHFTDLPKQAREKISKLWSKTKSTESTQKESASDDPPMKNETAVRSGSTVLGILQYSLLAMLPENTARDLCYEKLFGTLHADEICDS